jgi:hypothetical protein
VGERRRAHVVYQSRRPPLLYFEGALSRTSRTRMATSSCITGRFVRPSTLPATNSRWWGMGAAQLFARADFARILLEAPKQARVLAARMLSLARARPEERDRRGKVRIERDEARAPFGLEPGEADHPRSTSRRSGLE